MSTILINHFATFLNRYNFNKTAEFMRTCRRLGTDSPRARKDETGIFDVLRGLALVLSDQDSGFKMWNSLSMVRKFENDVILYEEWKRDLKWSAPKVIANLVSESSLRGDSLRILDIGCYDGEELKIILEHPILGRNVRAYTGIDLSSSALEKAREIFSAHKDIDYKFIQGNALEKELYESIPYKNNLITCLGVCDYLTPTEIKMLLKYSADKLSDNGRMYFSYPTSPSPEPRGDRYEMAVEEDIKYFRVKALDQKKNFCYVYFYSPEEFQKIANSYNLELLTENSTRVPFKRTKKSFLVEHDYVCLVKRESLLAAKFPAASPIAQQLACILAEP